MPRIQTWAINRVPRPIVTSGPITQYGPISTSSAIRAAGIDARGVSDYGCHGCLILPPDDFRKSGRASGSPVQTAAAPHSSRAGFTVGRARDAIGFHDHEPKLGLGG